MYLAHLQQGSDGVVVQLPQELLAELHLKAGQSVAMEMVDGSLVLRASSAARYELAAMLAECDFTLPVDAEEYRWMGDPASGRELL